MKKTLLLIEIIMYRLEWDYWAEYIKYYKADHKFNLDYKEYLALPTEEKEKYL